MRRSEQDRWRRHPGYSVAVIVDAEDIPAESVLNADLCVVGCGAAGMTIARELAGSSLGVIVLESGGLVFESETNDLNVGGNIGLPYFPLEAARLRYFGGSTNHWGGVCRPLEPIDFEARNWIPGSGWPIARSDLDPYYPRAATQAGLSVADWDLAHWSAKSPFPVLPLSGDPIETVVAQVVETDRRRFARRDRAPIEAAQNVTVYLHANAMSIDTDAAGRHVEQIRAGTLAGNRFSVTARSFVIATGGIENARLLLASDGVQPNGVGNDHDMVGRHFMEHPRFRAGVVLPTDQRLRIGFYEAFDVEDTTLQGYLTLSNAAARQEELTDVQIRLNPIYDPAIQAALDGPEAAVARDFVDRLDDPGGIGDAIGELGKDLALVTSDLMTWQQAVIPGGPLVVPLPEVVDEVVQRAGSGQVEAALPLVFGDLATAGFGRLVGGLPLLGIWLSTRIEQVPNPLSRVSLADERDAFGIRRVQLDWQFTDIEKRSVVRALELFGAELGRTGLGRLRIEIDDDPTSWPDDLVGGWHHMGTTRMSADPAHGVVDRDCLVHGMDNLYVAGSSVFTTAGSGTPTMTIVALALRLCDHLRQELT
jgi:choline dehydrogenase-like flavoprotein